MAAPRHTCPTPACAACLPPPCLPPPFLSPSPSSCRKKGQSNEEDPDLAAFQAEIDALETDAPVVEGELRNSHHWGGEGSDLELRNPQHEGRDQTMRSGTHIMREGQTTSSGTHSMWGRDQAVSSGTHSMRGRDQAVNSGTHSTRGEIRPYDDYELDSDPLPLFCTVLHCTYCTAPLTLHTL